MKARLYV